jgi:hypothetical protein
VEVATILHLYEIYLCAGLPTPLWNKDIVATTCQHVGMSFAMCVYRPHRRVWSRPVDVSVFLNAWTALPIPAMVPPFRVFEVTFSPKLEFITLNFAIRGLFRAFISWEGGVWNYWGRHPIMQSLVLQRRDRGRIRTQWPQSHVELEFLSVMVYILPILKIL